MVRETGELLEICINKFDEESAQKFREAMITVSKEDRNKPIFIYIDSYGGYVDSLAKMIETMDEIPNLKVTITLGKAMSCGAVLLSHGDVRFCGPHSRVMIHEISGGSVGNINDLVTDVKEAKRMNEWAMGLLARNCGIKGGHAGLKRIMKDQENRDLYLNAKQALKLGIVDAIGFPKLQMTPHWQVTAVPPKKGRSIKLNLPEKSDSIKRKKGKRNVK